MLAYPVIAAGDLATAQVFKDLPPVVIYATTAQSVSNTVTVTNDLTLTVPLLANAGYFVEFFISYSQSGVAAGIADFRTAWGVPTNATGLRHAIGATNTTAQFGGRTNTTARMAGHLFTTEAVYSAANTAGTPGCIHEAGAVNTSGTAGNVTFRFAQGTARVINTTRDAHSFVRVTRFI